MNSYALWMQADAITSKASNFTFEKLFRFGVIVVPYFNTALLKMTSSTVIRSMETTHKSMVRIP